MSSPNADLFFILIDDNPIDIFISERIIKAIKPESGMTKFTDASKAIEYLKSTKIDAQTIFILLDIYMPGMDGFEFLEQYNELNLSNKNQIRIIVLSSSTNQYDVARAKGDVNVHVMLQKPLTPDSLLPSLQIQS